MSQERTGSQVLHVRENSASEMEALFKVVDPRSQESNVNKSIPLRDRNLPPSFFQQPGLKPAPCGPEAQGFSETGQVSHMRAHSSPASLQQTLSVAPPPTGQQHQRQQSCELLEDPLPPGWGMARTPQGQRYFLNHRLQTTTWQDPRKTQQQPSPNASMGSPSSLGSLSPSQQPSSPAAGTQTPPAQIDVSKLPLPAGWEKAYTAEGEMYFINHIDRTTSWFHPSLPPQQQRLSMRLPNRQSASPAQQLSPSQHSSGQHSPQSPQQQAVVCSAGSDAATSPSLAVSGAQSGAPHSITEQQRLLKLKQLQLEKELLLKRQEEIQRQEMLIRTGVVGMEVGDSTEMTTVTDPFLGQTGSSTDHSRQESADSGLGGMGSGYSLSRPTDDFLTSMDDMDIQDGVAAKLGVAGEYGVMEMASVGDASDSQTMDSEDLVPSLQEDISSELLDVENVLNANKVDNLLTWL